MSDTLRDQLLGLGFKPAPKPERHASQQPGASQQPKAGHAGHPEQRKPAPGGAHRHGKPHGQGKGKSPVASPQSAPRRPAASQQPKAGHAGHAGQPARSREEMDLAKAYAMRAQKEKNERIEAERLKQEEARLRREAKAKLETFLQDKGLNDAGAEFVRHFPYGGKIKRVHVTEAQLKALNAGELGVAQLNGRYLLVDAATLAEVEAIFPQAVALKVDPDAPAENDPYADPKYQVPDDLVW